MAVVLAEVCRSNDRLASAVQLLVGVKIKYRLTLTTSMQMERRNAGLSELGSAGNVEPAAAGGSKLAEAQLAAGGGGGNGEGGHGQPEQSARGVGRKSMLDQLLHDSAQPKSASRRPFLDTQA